MLKLCPPPETWSFSVLAVLSPRECRNLRDLVTIPSFLGAAVENRIARYFNRRREPKDVPNSPAASLETLACSLGRRRQTRRSCSMAAMNIGWFPLPPNHHPRLQIPTCLRVSCRPATKKEGICLEKNRFSKNCPRKSGYFE